MKNKRRRWLHYVCGMGGLCILAGLFVVAQRNRQQRAVILPVEKTPAYAARPLADHPSSSAVVVPSSPKVSRLSPAENGFQQVLPPLRDPQRPRPMDGGSPAFRRKFSPEGAKFS